MNRGTQKASRNGGNGDNGDPSGGLGAPGRAPFLEGNYTISYHSDNPEPTTLPPTMPGKSCPRPILYVFYLLGVIFMGVAAIKFKNGDAQFILSIFRTTRTPNDPTQPAHRVRQVN